MKCTITILILLGFNLALCQSPVKDEWMEKRDKMVEEQILARGIYDKDVLKAMNSVERHKFVPGPEMKNAYQDRPLPIGYGQTISQPYIVALMTQELNLRKEDRILEIGTGSGYQAAVLAEIVDSVFTIEIVDELASGTKQLFEKLGYKNIYAKSGDGFKGWPEKAPFDAIIVTCAPTQIPVPLQIQLAEGGRMIIPVGERFFQELVLLKKKNGKIKRESVVPVRFVPMVDEHGNPY